MKAHRRCAANVGRGEERSEGGSGDTKTRDARSQSEGDPAKTALRFVDKLGSVDVRRICKVSICYPNYAELPANCGTKTDHNHAKPSLDRETRGSTVSALQYFYVHHGQSNASRRRKEC